MQFILLLIITQHYELGSNEGLENHIVIWTEKVLYNE